MVCKLNYNKTTKPSFFGEFRVSAHGTTGSELYTTSEAAIINVARYVRLPAQTASLTKPKRLQLSFVKFIILLKA